MIPMYEVDDPQQYLPKLLAVREKVDAALAQQIKPDGTLRTAEDIRYGAISRIGILIDATRFGMTMLSAHAFPLDGQWWDEVFEPPPGLDATDNLKRYVINAFDNSYTKFAFLQQMFANIDNSFRILLRVIEPGALQKATGSFEQIQNRLADHLNASTPATITAEDIKLLDLLRNARNSQHNNGVYFHKSWTDKEIEYKGEIYQFKIEKTIKFVTWDWLIERLEDVLILLDKIVMEKSVAAFPEISDPFVADRVYL